MKQTIVLTQEERKTTMREILFKAKRLDNGEWIEGCYWTNLFGNHFIRIAQDKAGRFTIDDYEIDPDTLCQFTGMTDKDYNKIWENDIVDISDCLWDAPGPAGYDSSIVLVEWSEINCGFDPFANYDCDCGVYYDAKSVKVIGNKFDNPELLKGDN